MTQAAVTEPEAPKPKGRASWGTRRVLQTVRAEMTAAGLSLEAVAKASGISVGGLEYVFSLQSEAKAETLERIVAAVERLAAERSRGHATQRRARAC